MRVGVAVVLACISWAALFVEANQRHSTSILGQPGPDAPSSATKALAERVFEQQHLFPLLLNERSNQAAAASSSTRVLRVLSSSSSAASLSKDADPEACDTAFVNKCLTNDACIECFLEMETQDIDWASVSPDTPCPSVVSFLQSHQHCNPLGRDTTNINAFCDTFNVCVVWDDGSGSSSNANDDPYSHNNNNNNPDNQLDCSKLTECKWDGMHAGFVGNGICNDYDCYNTAICQYDGGDCCVDTCKDATSLVNCGHDGYYCRDPTSNDCNTLLTYECQKKKSGTSNSTKIKPDCPDGTSLWGVVQRDSFGDGWDSTKMTITPQSDSNKVVYSGALESGSQGLDYVCLSKSPTCYHVSLKGGMWGKEISWEVKPLSEGAPSIASGGAPMECNFGVGGACESTCSGNPNVDPTKDKDYKQLKDLYTCIQSKCVIQAGACQADDVCKKCFAEDPKDYCFGNDFFNALIDCSVCKCTDSQNSQFCATKGSGVTPSNSGGGGSSGGTPSKRTCTPSETVAGGTSVITFSKCINFEQVTMLIPDYDTNNFGLLDKFEACAHSYNTADHGGHTALGCLQILVNAMNGGADATDTTAPKEAIESLAKSLYQDGEHFCDCAKDASDKCPLCESFLNFKTLLYESMDACQALDEIDCDAWNEFYKPCQTNLVSQFKTVDFSQDAQCKYVRESCGGAGPFPAFRRLDCDKELSSEAWGFYQQYAGKCKTGAGPTPSDGPKPAPKPAPVPVPSNPGGKPTPKPYVPSDDKPYVKPSDAKPYVSPDDKKSYAPPEKTKRSWRWFWNLVLLGIVGGVAYYVYKRRSEGFNFIRYRRMRNTFRDDSDMYMGLSMESSTSFEPPRLPPTPAAMGYQVRLPLLLPTATTTVQLLDHDRITLTAKPHAFAGAVLSPKHARELTPSLALAIASALAEQQSHRKSSVPYTLWITEAWRVLGWAEPSAALFWEMATMYHTLYLAAKAYAAEYHDGSAHNIPPILSCGSTSSMGSGMTADRSASFLERSKKYGSTSSTSSNVASAKELPVWLVGTFLLLHCEEFAYQRNLSGQDDRRFFGEGTSVGSSSVGRSGSGLSGLGIDPLTTDSSGRLDFSTIFKTSSLSPRTRLHAGWNHDNTHCTAYLLRHLRKVLLLTAISHNPEAIRACMHLAAIPSPMPHHPALPSASYHHPSSATSSPSTSVRRSYHNHNKYSADELRRQHDEEHGNVGLSVHLNMDDMEKLHLILQPPSGGGIDDPPLKIGDYLFQSLYQSGPPPPTATMPIGDVERELRRHLELELLMAGLDPDDKDDDGGVSTDDDDASTPTQSPSSSSAPAGLLSSASTNMGGVTSGLAKLSLTDKGGTTSTSTTGTQPPGDDLTERAKQPHNQYHKELSYTHLRGTTILLKPNPPESSSGASSASGEPPPTPVQGMLTTTSSGRLHDVTISDCSDAHFYLLQPFEHATISACTGCTIVVGAVAGLLHVVDCEKTAITSAGRRILVSNSSDVQVFLFTPSPPLLVGDNRTCQFAPYNTYYDGLREDLLATGLAAAVLPENQSPYHGTRNVENDAAWPPLQCASNKWKQPVELSKLEVPQIPATGPASPTASPTSGGAPSATSGSTGANSGNHSGSSTNSTSAAQAGADDKAMGMAGGNDATMLSPILMPASEFHILFVPLESDAARLRRLEIDETDEGSPVESPYCQLLAEILQLSPFRLPVEFERRALMKAERMRTIQQAVKKNLSEEQQHRFEEELNRGFREWLVQSGNLRQVLDLVHLERRGGT